MVSSSTATTPWWSTNTVALVTGANKGLGYAIVRKLAEVGLTVILTARDPAKGQTAIDTLRIDTGLQSIFFHPLEVRSSESAQALAKWVKEKFGGLDILVNNAGVSTNTITYQDAEDVIGTNYYGVKNVTESLLPLLRPSPAGARIINVSSRAALYERLGESLRKQFKDEEDYSVELMDSMAAKYLEDKRADRMEEEGWIVGPEECPKLKEPIYSESKMFMNGYTFTLANKFAKSQPEGQRIYVVGFCPGLVNTDMLTLALRGGFKPPPVPMKTSAEGADTGVWLALMPKEEIEVKNGKLFGERQEYSFGWVVSF
ncbi:unnamed protein product [Calypogeia fissa]